MAEETRWDEGMLEELGRTMVFPASPDLRGAVLAQLSASGERGPAPRTRLVLAGAVAVVLAAAVVITLSREARDAVADFLGLAVEGERIEVLPTPPAGVTATPFPSPLPVQSQLDRFARQVMPDEAAVTLGLPLRLPGSLGEPRAFWAIAGGPGIVIADYGEVQVWEMRYTGEYFIGKGIVGGGTVVQQVDVDGSTGYWVSGGERVVSVAGASGTPVASTQRTVTANALLWSADGLYRRIEGAGTLEEAMRLAREMP